MAAKSIRTGVAYDTSSTAHDGRHAGAKSRTAYTNNLYRARISVRMPLQQVAGKTGTGRCSGLSTVPAQGKRTGTRVGSHHHRSSAICIQSFDQESWVIEEVIPAPKNPDKLPTILSPEEVLQFLCCVSNVRHHAILTTCYAGGLRISEVLRLKPLHIDSQRMVIRVEQGKGQKDRYVMLSARLLEILRQYFRAARPIEWLFEGR